MIAREIEKKSVQQASRSYGLNEAKYHFSQSTQCAHNQGICFLGVCKSYLIVFYLETQT